MARVDSGDVAIAGAMAGAIISNKLSGGDAVATLGGAGISLIIAGRMSEEVLD